MEQSKQCKGCKCDKPINQFGEKTNGNFNLFCILCVSKNKKNPERTEEIKAQRERKTHLLSIGKRECRVCKEEKLLEEFSFTNVKNRKARCKKCESEKSKDYYLRNKEAVQRRNKVYSKKYYEANKEKVIAQNKLNYWKNRKSSEPQKPRLFQHITYSPIKELPPKLEIKPKWDESGQLVLMDLCRNANRTNKKKHGLALWTNEYQCQNCVNKEIEAYNHKLIVRIRTNLRGRFKEVLNGALKYKGIFPCSRNDMTSCSGIELKKHLESQFRPGMTWDNYGTEWHIDHIKPLAAFDLSIPEEQKRANHHKNFQPLWAIENLRKGDYYEEKA